MLSYLNQECMSNMPSTSEIEMSPKNDENEDENLNSVLSNPESKMASRLDEGCELQQLVGDDDENRGGATPPVSPTVCRITQTSPSTPNSTKRVVNGQEYERIPTCDDDAIQVSTPPAGPDSKRSSAAPGPSPSQGTSLGSVTSRSLSRTATAPSMSSANNGPNTRLLYVNEKLSRGPSLISEHGGTRAVRERNPKAGQNAPRAEMKRGRKLNLSLKNSSFEFHKRETSCISTSLVSNRHMYQRNEEF
ncbi:Cyanate hydratase [Frankliniella fusca]|uniref:Cyanate hydratase n=1 Tax=Frankliniella fusca TaxID=407009 RepID=A0AAE1HSC0_9NEOP|nr:Cyanate hydratase [Frankliniella fusca]